MPMRKSIDCRRFPGETDCTLMISGAEPEVLRAAALHATTVHGHTDSPDLREQLRASLEDESPPRPEPGRKFVDCRAAPSTTGCTLRIAGREDEVLTAALAHAVSVHGHRYSPLLSAQLRSMLREELGYESGHLSPV